VKTRVQRITPPDTAALTHCHNIRREVFCEEQGISADLEWDDFDAICTHYLLFIDDVPAVTARIRPYKPGEVKIERVAALKKYRGQGLGLLLMEHILADLKANAPIEAILNAQTIVRDFYTRLGFEPHGPEFVEAEIPHIHMRLKLG
jgi:predicted GNAT family N-acyltransferase